MKTKIILLSVSMALALLIAPKAFAVHQFSKTMIVIFENTNYDDVIDLPFFKKLSSEGALLTNFHAEAHPSQPNYIALISGDTQGCRDDSNINVDATNITDRLDAKGKTWKVYAEAYPGNCFKGKTSGTYARKHNPFISFKSIQKDAAKCSRIVNASELQRDVKNGTVPDYSFYVPDMNNDGHDTGPEFAEKWYSKTFGPLIRNSNFMDGMLLITTFDESALDEPSNLIYTSLYGAGVRAGAVSNAAYDHYSLLRTIEDAFGLGTMADNDDSASAITGVWK